MAVGAADEATVEVDDEAARVPSPFERVSLDHLVCLGRQRIEENGEQSSKVEQMIVLYECSR